MGGLLLGEGLLAFHHLSLNRRSMLNLETRYRRLVLLLEKAQSFVSLGDGAGQIALEQLHLCCVRLSQSIELGDVLSCDGGGLFGVRRAQSIQLGSVAVSGALGLCIPLLQTDTMLIDSASQFAGM